MTALPRRLLAATVIAVLCFAPVTAVSAQTAPADAQVYLLRGLLNIFSLGMDTLAEKLKAQGFQPVVSTWESGSLIADQIVKARRAGGGKRPIILIGHSLGANTTLEISRILGENGIPVDLVVTFDPTVAGIAPANIVRFINFFVGHRIEPGPGFKGQLDNMDLTADGGITHTSIDKIDRIHQFVIARMLEITGGPPPKAQGKR
jgi:hypothetical protein